MKAKTVKSSFYIIFSLEVICNSFNIYAQNK